MYICVLKITKIHGVTLGAKSNVYRFGFAFNISFYSTLQQYYIKDKIFSVVPLNTKITEVWKVMASIELRFEQLPTQILKESRCSP